MLHIPAADLVLVPVTPGEGDLVEAQRPRRTINGARGCGSVSRRLMAHEPPSHSRLFFRLYPASAP